MCKHEHARTSSEHPKETFITKCQDIFLSLRSFCENVQITNIHNDIYMKPSALINYKCIKFKETK